MPSPEEMRELAEGIVASHRSRKQAIASLKKEVRNQLAGDEKDHQAMAKELHATLEADNAALMKELAKGDKARKKEVKSQQSGYQSDHQAMAKEVRAELAQAKAQLKTDTAALMKELGQTTKARKKEVKGQLRGYGAEMGATRRGWQEGLRGAPPKPKPKPKPRARKKAPVKAAPPKESAE